MPQEQMNNEDWDKLEDLLRKVVDMEADTYQEKRKIVEENIDSGILGEFIAWFQESE